MKNFISGLKYGKVLLLVALLSILGVSTSYASHVSGGSIKYKALGSNQYYIEVAVFRDCSGIQYSSATATVTAQCMPAGTPTNYTLNHLAFVAPTPAFGGPYSAITFTSGGTTLSVEEVSDVCDKILNPSTTPNSRCRGGTALGYTRFKYSGVITLTACNYWRLHFIPQCCRNTGSSNISTGGMSVETWFDTQNFPNNSAPDFADEVKPIPSACVGKEVKYGIGTIDQDGDSLRFEVACAKGSISSCVTYRSGFSSTAPADSFSLDSATGLIRFVPKTSGKRVVAFWVKEYERCTGTWKAQTLRDVQFRVESCNNNIPKDISGIANIQNGLKLEDFKLQVCNGSILQFEDTIFDPDANDTLVFQSNHDVVLPGSQMTVTHLQKNKAVVRFTWQASIGNNPIKIFYLVFNDDKCDYPGNGFSVFELEVRNSTSAGEDIAICKGDTVKIEASGGKLYEWKSVWGDSLIWSGPGRNVWGDTTANDTNKTISFYPTQTTFVEVWSDLSEGCVIATACQDKDSVKIIVAKNFGLNKHNDTTICFNDSTIGIWALPDSSHSSFEYKWEDAQYMNNDTIYNPTVTPIQSRYFHVTVESDSGCVRNDSVYVELTPPFPPNIVATASDTFVCQGTKSYLDINLGYVPTSCGLSQHACVGATVQKQFGYDTTHTASSGSATTVWPNPYGNDEASAKMQFLYTANELQSLGVTAGLITGIGFNVKTVTGTSVYSGFTIKIKCKNDTILNTWEMGAHQVFNPKTVNVTSGWNSHQFDTPYDYDGSSNLIVEICFTNTSKSQSSQLYYTQTGFNSCLAVYGSGSQCASQTLGFSSRTNRPNTRFDYCKGPNPAAYNYQWIPSLYLNTDTVKDPIATVLDSVTYYALVTDTFGKCDGYTTPVKINLSKLEIGRDTVLCPYDTVQIAVNPTTKCTGPTSFKWVASDTNAYISNDTIANPFFMAVQNTSFQLTFSDTCGCVIVDTFNITMRSLPNPTVNRTTPSCGLDNGSLSITGLGGIAPYEYSLYNSITTVKDSNSTGSFNNLNNGYYTIRVTDAGKCFIEVTDTFTNTAPIIDSINTKNLTCYRQGDGEIDVFASQGIPPLTYSIDSGATWGTASTLLNLTAQDYNVVARSSDGCVTKPVPLTLTEPDSLFASLYYTEVSCWGAADAQAIAVSQGGTLPYTFNWGNGASTDTVKGLSGGLDSLVLSDANGCQYVQAFNIIEYPEVIIDSVTYTQVTCNGYDDGSIQVYARGGKQAIFYSSNQGGIYSSFNTFGGLEPKGYGIRVQDVNGCTARDTVTIIEPDEVEIFANLDSQKICVSNCADLLVTAKGGNGSFYDFHWTPGISSTAANQRVCPDGDSKYWVYAKDTVGCISIRKEIVVNFYDSLKVVPTGEKVICENEEVELSATSTGGDGIDHVVTWFPGAGINNPNSWTPIVTPDTTRLYGVSLSDKCGSPFDTAFVLVRVLEKPDVQFEVDTSFACNPGEIRFTNTTNAVSVNCLWDFGDGSIADRCDNVPYIYPRAGFYDVTLTVTDNNGCTDSLTKESFVQIALTPIARFKQTPENPTILKPEVQFTDLSEGQKIVEWNWNFAGFETSDEQNPEFIFPETHKDYYFVKLEVRDSNTCVGETTEQVFIGPEFSFYIPSAFSPNGDGLNDVWKPVGNGVNPKQYQAMVFNRWGQLVFETNDFNTGWDGINQRNGELVASGLYTYQIRVGDTFGEREEHTYSGTISVVYTKEGEQ